MRDRQRITPNAPVAGSMLQHSQIRIPPSNGGFTGPDVYATVPCDMPRPSLSRIIDSPDWDRFINDCFHVKDVLTVSGYQPDFGAADVERVSPYVNGLTDLWEFQEIPTHNLWNLASASAPELTRPFPWRKIVRDSGYGRWAQAEWKQPRIEVGNGFNLVNFLLELKESITLVKSWTSKKGLVRRYHNLRAKNKSLAGKAAAIANERLAYVYGTKLFVADAFRLWRLLTGWRERWQKFLDTSNTLLRVYKRDRLSYSYPAQTRRIPFPVFGYSDSFLVIETEDHLDSYGVLYYTYRVNAITGFLARLSQLGDAYGVILDAGIVWDAIPLTFVVDWFYNVGDYLHANWSKGAWNKIEVPILESGHSFRIEHHTKVSWERNVWSGVSSPQRATDTLFQRDVTIYRRERDREPIKFAKTLFKRNTSQWSDYRILNAAALGIVLSYKNAKWIKRKFKRKYP